MDHSNFFCRDCFNIILILEVVVPKSIQCLVAPTAGSCNYVGRMYVNMSYDIVSMMLSACKLHIIIVTCALSVTCCSKPSLLSTRWDRSFFFIQGGNLMCQTREEVSNDMFCMVCFHSGKCVSVCHIRYQLSGSN